MPFSKRKKEVLHESLVIDLKVKKPNAPIVIPAMVYPRAGTIPHVQKTEPPKVEASVVENVPAPVATPVVAQKEKSTSKSSPLLIATFAAIGLGIIGGASAFWITHHGVQFSPQHASTLSVPAPQTTVAELQARVGKLMALPEGEEPSIALVSDVQSLKDQLFFKNAKNGDFVLMYAKARRAILFDAVNNKIVEVAPITDGP